MYSVSNVINIFRIQSTDGDPPGRTEEYAVFGDQSLHLKLIEINHPAPLVFKSNGRTYLRFRQAG